jgi:hypothetical protein
MDISNKPMETLQQWQEWYRANRKVASLDEPLVSKESRENLHDTVNAVDALPDWRAHYKELISDMETNNDVFKQKAKEHFADTIAEFMNELTGAEMFECFQAAAVDIFESQKKELDSTQQLIDLLMGKDDDKNDA